MTPATAELTVYQSKRDPEWAALSRTFWTIRPHKRECEQCGDVFEAQPANRLPARYCSVKCRRRAQHDRDMERRGRAA